MDRGVWGAIVHRVTKSQTRLKQLSTHSIWARAHALHLDETLALVCTY